MSKPLCAWAGVLMLVWAHAGFAHSGSTLKEITPDGTTTRTLPAGAGVSVATTGGTPVVSASTGLPGAQRVIVQLREPPLVRAVGSQVPAAARQAARNTLAAEHARVLTEIHRLQGGRAVAAGAEREFLLTFNGIAVTLSPAAQLALRGHADVRAIYPDVQVSASYEDWGVTDVGAPAFWAGHAGYRGAGIVIAVIDTGIDYTHADLGGCVAVGGGCKVIGGYDFANNDSDPRDDHGHGTHVAAIAAGNGGFSGVAPDAELLAYKVLDANGSGPWSDVIAGIERAVDPDGDLDPSDHADVINMSLGGPGDADDPIAQAVDAATAAGVFVAVAAGNSGGYQRIGSPGSARTALTVGAVDNTGALAGFTSGGPAAGSYGMKPEIAGPGVNVCAAQADGTALGASCVDATHISLSGTSMATPHVAGAAALLRGVFPTFSVADIKSLLVQNSDGSGALDALKAGAGVVDLPAAGMAATVVAPAAISFGLDDVTLTTWTTSQTLTVRNIDSSPRSYTLTAAPYFWGLPAGASITFNPASFMLGAGASTSVTVQLSVDNTQAADASFPAFSYDAMITLASGTETQRIPAIFLKTSLLRVHTDQLANSINVIDPNNPWNSLSVLPVDTTTEILVPSSTYDVLVVYPGTLPFGTFVIHEGVSVSGVRDETVNASEAVYTLTLAGTDKNGQPLSDNVRTYSLYHHASGLGFAVMTDATGAFTISSGPLSSAYDLDMGLKANLGADMYLVTNGARGLSANQTFTNTAAQLTHGAIRYSAAPGESIQNVTAYLYFISSFGFAFGMGGPVPGPDGELYVTPVPHAGYRAFVQTAIDSIGGGHIGPLHRGSTAPGVIEAYNVFDPEHAVYRTSTGELPLNLGPATFFAKFFNTPWWSMLQMSVGGWAWTFHAQGGDGPDAPGGLTGWRFTSNGAELSSGQAPQSSFGGPFLPFIPTANGDFYGFETDRVPYWLGGIHATSHMAASFDTSFYPADVDPPYFGNVTVRSAGALTHVVAPGATATVRLEVHDAADPAGIALKVSRLLGTGPMPVTFNSMGAGVFQADVVCGPMAEAVNLLVTATDSSGNELRNWLYPAFVCRPATCGNNTLEAGEVCDDGNSVSGDGCNAICSSTEACGDGVLDAGEQCDDGNLVDGDCCSSTCQFEAAGSPCPDDGLFCNGSEACDGSGTCGRHLNAPCSGQPPCGRCNEATQACLAPAGVICYQSFAPCDPAEVCDGTNLTCPGAGVAPAPAGTECRSSTAACDPAEVCDGSNVTCPDDVNACSATPACTDVDGNRTFTAKPKATLKLGNVNLETTPGNDAVKLSAGLDLPPGKTFADLQPELHGARILLQSATGVVRADVVLGAGAFANGVGWKRSAKSIAYFDRTATPNNGIVKVGIKNLSAAGPGHVKLKVLAKGGTYPVIDADRPVKLTLVLGNQADADVGLCGETAYGTADCVLKKGGTAIACKR